MNYKLVDNDWDQQLRDAMADMPAPTDEEIEELVNGLWKEEQEREQERYWSGRSRVRV